MQETVKKNKKFAPVIWVGNTEFHVREVNHDRIFLMDGRKLHWSNFFGSETEFKNFVKRFEKFKCDSQMNFMNAFHSLLTQYNVSLDIESCSDDCCVFRFDIGGNVTEVKASKPINSQRIADIILLREKLNA